MFAGKTLAEIAQSLADAPELERAMRTEAARAELQSRIARPNAKPSSVKRSQDALDRLAAGASCAIPARPEKTPEQVAAAAARAERKAAAPARKNTRKAGDEITLNEAMRIAKSYGYPIARHWGAIAKLGANAPRKAARTNA